MFGIFPLCHLRAFTARAASNQSIKIKTSCCIQHKRAVNSSHHIVEDNSPSAPHCFQPPRRKRLPDIEDAKQREPQQQATPVPRHCSCQREPLADHFIHHHKSGIFPPRG